MKKEIYILISENKNLIYSIAHKYSSYSCIDDLFQAGCIGLMNAYKNYDKKSNTKFSTYAYTYIVGEIISFIRNDRLIKVNSENKKIYKLYEETKEYLTKLNSREVSFKEIADYLNINEYDLYSALSNNYELESIDSCIYNDMPMEEVIGMDERDKVDEMLDLQSEMDKLKEEERKIINYRYFNDYTQTETAQAMGMSQVQVSRCESKILSKMKKEIVA